MKEKILITGGAGFIGSHAVDAFIAAGHDVVVVDDLSSGRLVNLNPKAKFYQMDIRSPEVRQVLFDEKPGVIFHYAAQIDVRKSVADPLLDADINILGSIRLAQFAIEMGVRKFVHISSGGAAYGEPVYLPCDENHPIRPLCPYGASKYTFELYLYMFKELYGMDFSVLRLPNVYGPRQDPLGEAGVVAIFTGRMLRREPVTINGSGEQVRDFVYVGDIARANLLVLHNGSGQVYNLGFSMGTSVNQIFQQLKEIIHYPLEPLYGPPKAGETFRIYLNAAKAKQELGWEPEITLREGLTLTVDYFRMNELT
mgnify:CR=1 FL=1